MRYLIALVLLAGLAIGGLACSEGKEAKGAVVVTTSMLGEVAGDVLPLGDDLEVVSIVPPGTCPGHFDLSPRALPMLKGASLVLIHDYQKPLAEKIREVGPGDAVEVIETPGSLLIPDNYKNLGLAVAARGKAAFPEKSEGIEAGVQRFEAELQELEAELKGEASAWAGVQVVASTRQAGFARWLGLDVVGTFPPPDAITPKIYEALKSSQPKVVIGNLQEGTQGAVAIGERLEAPVVIFSNFPGAEGYGESYGDLQRANIALLKKALGESGETE